MADIVWKRGDTFVEDLTFTAAGGGAFNLTGASVRWTLKANINDPDGDAILTHTIGAGITVTNAVNGIAVHTITAAEMATLAPGVPYVWDFQVRAADLTVKTPLEGKLTVSADVSQTVP